MHTYESRLSKITNSEDIDTQISMAMSSAKIFRRLSNSSGVSLSDKLLLERKAIESEKTLQQLTTNYFNIYESLGFCGQPLTISHTVNR